MYIIVQANCLYNCEEEIDLTNKEDKNENKEDVNENDEEKM